MRVPGYEFPGKPFEHIVSREALSFLRHLRVEKHLQQQVAKFAAQFVPVAIVNSFEDLVSLLERVRLDGIECLLAVPRTPSRPAQTCHDGNRALESFAG